MKEGRLSSDLLERYGISEQNAIGKVLWHSLNENGDIGVYDMKFGNTIVRNLTENELLDEKCPPHCNETKHGVQNENEAARGNAGVGEKSDVDRVLRPDEVKLIDTTKEYKQLVNLVITHAAAVPQGGLMLRKLHMALPNIIKDLQNSR